jgi:hypothetical protein
MDDPLGMGGGQRFSHLATQPQHLLDVHRLLADRLLQGRALEELHDDKRCLTMAADLVDGADVWVVQGRGGPRLAQEALECLLVGGDVLGEELERHLPSEIGVLGLVDDAHAATAQLGKDLVVGNGLPNHDDLAKTLQPFVDKVNCLQAIEGLYTLKAGSSRADRLWLGRALPPPEISGETQGHQAEPQ